MLQLGQIAPDFEAETTEGRIRFHEEDVFVDPAAGRALISWTCTLERDGKTRAWRGLDVLHVRDGRIVVKETYAKAERPKTAAR